MKDEFKRVKDVIHLNLLQMDLSSVIDNDDNNKQYASIEMTNLTDDFNSSYDMIYIIQLFYLYSKTYV